MKKLTTILCVILLISFVSSCSCGYDNDYYLEHKKGYESISNNDSINELPVILKGVKSVISAISLLEIGGS